MSFSLLSVTSLVLLLGSAAVGDSNIFTIGSAEELVQFSKDVNGGKSFSGLTVFLVSDIVFTDDLSSQFNPIGNANNQFKGIFDGQSHIISNITITSSTNHTGLFGHSARITIRNLVMDGSCSVTSTFRSSSAAYVGGIIGQFITSRKGVIENVVNMGSISFEGSVSGGLHLGGIVGVAWSSDNEFVIKNCVNYGPITSCETLSESNSLGGIVGQSIYGRKQIQNCLNYGDITYTGDKKSVFVGGITGFGGYGAITIDNCVNMGKIQVNNKGVTCVGNVAGHFGTFDSYKFTHCYWSSETGNNAYCGCPGEGMSFTDSYKFNTKSFEFSDPVSIESFTGKSLISALNASVNYNKDNNYSHWVLNKNKNNVKFTINGRKKSLELASQLILLPDIKGTKGYGFDGWYTSQSYTDKLVDLNIGKPITIYGKFDDNTTCSTITFETREGSPVDPFSRLPGTTLELTTNLTKEGYSFIWWEDSDGVKVSQEFTFPSHDVTVYAVWAPIQIHSENDLIDFSKVVNNGISYSGTTVFLEKDIDFTEELSSQFEPIGNDEHLFEGTFDGKGHVISNLEMSSNAEHIGLFGCANGASLKSVAFDGTCSFASLYGVSNNVFVGSVVGRCGLCTIESIVNMARISSERNVTNNLWMGGIVGGLTSGNNNTVRNCVNYGTITFAGNSEKNAYIGGIVGESYGRTVSNCANYGEIINNEGTTGLLLIGGIVGNWWNGMVENCLSAGKITLAETSNETRIRGIAGSLSFTGGAVIMHCFWTGDVGCSQGSEPSTSTFKVVDTSMLESLNVTTMEELNEYADNKDLSRWFVLYLAGGTVNNINQEVLVDTQNYYPDPTKEGYTFRHWSTDSECIEEYHHNTTPTTVYACFEPKTYLVSFDFGNGTVTSLDIEYGDMYNPPELSTTGFIGWFTGKDGEGDQITNETRITIARDHTIYAYFTISKYILTFIFGNGTKPEVRTLAFNETIIYPENVVREGHKFVGWDKSVSVMPAENLTITAKWAINKYTIIFNFENGTEPEVRTLAFNETIIYPENVVREGHKFIGWDKSVSVMPAENLTITALWTEKAVAYVEIVFERKDLTPEGVERLIKEYTDDNFVIEKFVTDGESGEIRAIIKFTDKEEAENFVEIIKADSNAGFKGAQIIDVPVDSFSFVVVPSFILALFF